MSRFNSLEFDGRLENEPRPASAATKDEGYYLAHAQASFEAGQFEPALRAYAKVLEFNPHNVAAWSGQVRMLIEQAEFAEARLWADKALERFPRDPELLAAKAVALGRLGDYQAALAYSDASIEVRGDTPYIWLARADVLLSRDESKAEFCFQKALGFAASDWFVRWLASRIYFYYKKFSLALKSAQQALALNGGLGSVWLQIGHCQLALGLADMAQNSFAQAQQLNPGDTQAREALQGVPENGLLGKIRSRFRQFFHSA